MHSNYKYKTLIETDPLYDLKLVIAEIGLNFYSLTSSLKDFKKLIVPFKNLDTTFWYIWFRRATTGYTVNIISYKHFISILASTNNLADLEKLIKDTEESVIKILEKFNIDYKK